MDFLLHSDQIINKIAEIIEDNDHDGDFDIDLNDAILTIETPDGIYVINKQRVLKEIWLSSPVTGPYHFAFRNNKWQTSKGVELFEVLTNELKIKIIYDQ